LSFSMPTGKLSAQLPVAGHPPVYTVGRREDCDIVLTGDKAVSRLHAKLDVSKGELTLIDCGTKYGLVRDATRCKEARMSLRVGDKIGVGPETSFEVSYTPLVLLASQLSKQEKNEMLQAGARVGADFAQDWTDDVTHLIMAQVSFTPKLLTALARAVPVVTREWLQQLASRSKPDDPIPKPEDYAPIARISDKVPFATPHDVAVSKMSRRSLFQGWDLVWLPLSRVIDKASIATNEKTNELLKLMGASVAEGMWSGGASDAAFVQVGTLPCPSKVHYCRRSIAPQEVHTHSPSVIFSPCFRIASTPVRAFFCRRASQVPHQRYNYCATRVEGCIPRAA
ncbi:MAG: hypothetical protein SGPRY_012349, partial [Prymnesium sp.]